MKEINSLSRIVGKFELLLNWFINLYVLISIYKVLLAIINVLEYKTI